MSPIDTERLRLRRKDQSSDRLPERGRPPRPRQGEKYLRGPIPLDWLSLAARLPGRSLHVAMALWFMAGLTRSRSVPLSNINGLRFGLDRNAKYRGLVWLEGAGLISVTRKLGRAPLVTIRDATRSPDVDRQERND
jgi:hypothetical protein